MNVLGSFSLYVEKKKKQWQVASFVSQRLIFK